MLSRSLAVFSLALLAACSGQSPQDAAATVKDGLTSVGETVQSVQSSGNLEKAGETAKAALTTTGEVATATADTAKEALTTVGETTVAVGEVAEGALTAIGTTVLEAKASLSVPEPAPAPPQSN
jgi:hypothetical protein